MSTSSSFPSRRPRRPSPSALIAAALLAVPLAALAGSPFKAGDRYVNLGSSYAAGPGVGTPDTASGGCDRSHQNYAHLYADKYQLDLVDVSCSGATTADILTVRQIASTPPQIDAVTASTKLVTVLIGGTDIDYIASLLADSCEKTTGRSNCGQVPAATVDKLLAALPAKLQNVVTAIRKRAPEAMIVFVDYLPVLPESGAGCAQTPFTPADFTTMRDIYVKFTLAEAAAASHANVRFVYTARLGAGHDACSAEPYTAGYYPKVTPGWKSAVQYHPNLAGMEAVAASLEQAISAP